MKKQIFLLFVFALLTIQAFEAYGQKRPPVTRKTNVMVTKPTTEPTPMPPPVQVSPAQKFFDEGLKCAAEDYDCQISNYTKAINLDLKTKEVFKNRGNAYLQRKDFDKAIADFTKLIELDLNDASGYKNRGKIYLENVKSPQHFEAAIRDFTNAIDLEPKDKEAFILRSKAHFSFGDFEKGRIDLASAIQIDPTNTELLKYQAKIYSLSENYDKAIETYSKIIALQPNSSETLVERGKAYESVKKFDLAAKDYNRAEEIDLKNPLPIINLAELFIKDKKFDEAVKEFTKAIELTPTNTDLLFKRAKLYRQLNKNAEASADITKVIELSPRNAKAYEFRCGIEKDVDNMLKAVEDCSIAISLDFNVDDAYIYRYQMFDLQQANLVSSVLKQFSDIAKGESSLQPIYDMYVSDSKLGSKNKRLNAGLRIRTGSQIAKDFEQLGSGEMFRGYYWLAEKNFTEALNLDPSSVDAYVGRGTTLLYKSTAENYGVLDENKLYAGLQDYQRAASIDPLNNNLINAMKGSFVSLGRRPDVLNLILEVLNTLIAKNPNDMSLLATRVQVRLEQFEKESKFDRKYERKLIKDDWNGIPRAIEADSRKIVELYSNSKKGHIENSAMGFAELGLSLPYNYEPSKQLELLDKLISQNPDYYGFYWSKAVIFKLNTEKGKIAWQKQNDLKKELFVRSYANLRNIYDAAQKGVDFVKKLPSTVNETATLSGFDQTLRQQEIQRIEREDDYADKLRAAFQAKAQQEIQRLQRESVEREQREKEEKARRNADTMNALFGLINITTEIITNNRQSTSQIPQPNTSSRPQTTQSGGTSTTINQTNGNSGSTVTGCNDGIIRGGTGFDCNQFVTSGHTVLDETTRASYWQEICKTDSICSQWAQTPLSQVYFRGRLGIDKSAKDKPYVWTIGFKNTSNSVVVFFPELIYGDGTTQPGDGVALTPGSETVWHVTWGTNSGSSEVSIRMRKYAICSNISRITDNGRSGYKCN